MLPVKMRKKVYQKQSKSFSNVVPFLASAKYIELSDTSSKLYHHILQHVVEF